MSGDSDRFDSIGRHLDVTDLDVSSEGDGAAHSRDGERMWVGVYYECCDAYSRVYRRREDLCYRGRCPRCGASVSIRVGPSGIAAKMLIATPV